MGWLGVGGFLVVLLAAGAGIAGAQDETDSGGPPPHGRLAGHVLADGIERSFVVHVPESVDGSRDVPLVVMLHGTSGDGEKFYNISGWVEKADAEGFIAVFPSALTYCLGDDDDSDGVISPREWKITTKWAAGSLGTPAMPLCTDEALAQFSPTRQATVETRTLRDDVAFIRAMTAALQGELPIDARRMYVTGFSNGGDMSGRLLIETSDTFAAFAMAAGTLAVPGPAVRPAPVAFSVGSLDDRVLGRTGLLELPIDGSAVTVPEIEGALAEITGAVGIDSTRYTQQARLVNGKTVALTTYDQSLVGASNVVLFAVIEDATHQYPNGTNHPVVMTDLLWPFFSRHVLP